MNKTAVLTADGVEEIEALAVVDILRRQKCDVDMISITDSLTVNGSHGIIFQADRKMSETDMSEYDCLVIPGGLKGTANLKQEPNVLNTIRAFNDAGKLIASICAGPTVLAAAGIMNKRCSCVYPGFENDLGGAYAVTDREVIADRNVITSRGMGTAVPFALAIVEYMFDAEAKQTMAEKIVFRTTGA